ncbi:MAG: ABC transporter ATP-binding protein [Candidatus Izemoplasmatales bacterium]
MKRRIRYFDRFPLVMIPIVANAVLAFCMSFAMKATIDAALIQDWTLFWDEAVRMIVFVALLLPVNLLTAYAKASFYRYVALRMKTDYVEAVFGKSIDEFQKENNAAYVSALTNDFAIIETDFVEQIVAIAEGVVNFATAIVIFSLISPLVLLVGAAMMVMNALISSLIERPVKKHNDERSKLFAGYNGFVKEVLSAFGIVKNNGLEERVRTQFRDKSRSVQEKRFVIDRLMSYVYVGQTATTNLVIIGLLLMMARLSMAGSLAFSGVVVVVNNIGLLIGPIFTVSEAFPRIRSVKAIFQRIDESLRSRDRHPETLRLTHFERSIRFRDVAIAYDDNLVLKDIDLTFEKGRKYLVVGPSGGGKSTFLRLLRKYFDPTEGTIEIDGLPLSDVRKEDYYARIANIEQTVFLFEDTLKNNLTLFKEHTEAEIAEAVAKAGLTEFVGSNPEGLDYMIYDNGKNVSGGEKSRIAIARGLLNHADVIMLDEAFASLDRDRAREIESTLLALDGVTVINVSHVVIEENRKRYDGVVVVKNHGARFAA